MWFLKKVETNHLIKTTMKKASKYNNTGNDIHRLSVRFSHNQTEQTDKSPSKGGDRTENNTAITDDLKNNINKDKNGNRKNK